MTTSRSSAEIRGSFIDYFTQTQGHAYAHSIPLIPAGDPTLLFTNSGMVQFKGVFQGVETRPYRRAANSQRCLRVSGKHNDLEDVGKDTYHHTFFEMLGNWSFGDYYKKEAIAWGWDLLTRVYGLEKDRLWASVYRDDAEAAGLWPKVTGVPVSRVLPFGEKDNFWEMGETGPCGPCSEIHYDRGAETGCGKPSCGPNCGCGRFIELWNLVFIQFNRAADGKLTELPAKHVDTGMGLERLVAILQEKRSNYDTDLFTPLLSDVARRTGLDYGADGKMDVSFRVLADHIRAMTFLVADGVVPTNEGRGYVLRRLMRRAIRHAKKLGIHEPYLFELSGRVVDLMKGAFPEVAPQAALIASVIKSEEERFMETLDQGLQLVAVEIEALKAEGKTTLPGDVAFRLYDTFGFPLDMTKTILDEENLHLDEESFQSSMERQREMGKSAWKARDAGGVAPELLLRAGELRTNFVGYDRLEHPARITALLSKGRDARQAKAGDTVEVVTDSTPFYPMGGGQVGDRGRLKSADAEGDVVDTHPVGAGEERFIVHRVKITRGEIRPGAEVDLVVDSVRRHATMLNHSATHLMHAALRETLGRHVRQYGSLVEPARLRFDFTHFAALTPAELKHIEDRVQAVIRANLAVECMSASMDEAKKMGALMFFGDKYGDVVRVTKMGDFSIELCGGTHVRATSEIGLFKFVQSGGVGAGVRRVQAVTGEGVLRELERLTEALEKSAGALNVQDTTLVPRRIDELVEENRRLRSELESLRAHALDADVERAIGSAKEVGSVKVVAFAAEGKTPDQLRALSDKIRTRLGSGLVLLATRQADRGHLVVALTPDLQGMFSARRLLAEVCKVVEGKGGGRDDFAQGVGKPEHLTRGLEAFSSIVEKA
ncbi:MAG: alanine--tRNA ligase [Nitrospirae bacterium]|nr:alanine--tRNA ligase [Nitrospirota bacterium]